MQKLTARRVQEAFVATGRVLSAQGLNQRVTVVVCGSIAGILGGHLGEDRRTLDCDLISGRPEERLRAVCDAAQAVSKDLGLHPNWLNHDSKMFAHLLPLGWKDRVQQVGRFGPLDVCIVGRLDLLALKLIGAVKRSGDLQDLEAMSVSEQDKVFLAEHLGRLEREDLNRETRDAERALLEDL